MVVVLAAGAVVAVVATVTAGGPGGGLSLSTWTSVFGRPGGGDASPSPPPSLPPRPFPPQLHAMEGGGVRGVDSRRREVATMPATAATGVAAPASATADVANTAGEEGDVAGGEPPLAPPVSPSPASPPRYFFPRWVAGSQLNNQLVRLAQLLHAAALTRGVLVLPPADAPSAVTAWLDAAALAAATPGGTLTTGAFLGTPTGRSLVAAGAIRLADSSSGGSGRGTGGDSGEGGGELTIGHTGAAGTVAVYPDWLVTRWEDEEQPPHNGTCAAATAFEYVGVDSLTLPPSKKIAMEEEGRGKTAPTSAAPMGVFMSTPWHYCGRRLGGWADAWRAIRPHPTLAAAAATYVAAAAAPLVAVHVRDLEDGSVPEVLDVTDGVAAEIHTALVARATATGVPPRTVYVSYMGEAPARVRNALADRLAAAGGWQTAVVVTGCAQLPGCTLPPASATMACTAHTCATATPTPASAATVAAFFASRAAVGGGGGIGGGVGMYEMAVWLAADYFIGVRASTMSVNAALMRAAGGPGVGGDGSSRVRDIFGFQEYGPFHRGWTQHYWTNTWTTVIMGEGRHVNSTFPLPGGGVGVLVPEMTDI